MKLKRKSYFKDNYFKRYTKGNSMQTIQIDVKDDKVDVFLQFLTELKNDVIDSITIKNKLKDIESIDENSQDFKELMQVKKQNNEKYSISQAKEMLVYNAN